MENSLFSTFVDKVARKPAGWMGKRLYSDPKGHYRSFRLVLDALNLTPEDCYLEIGCGGGVLLEQALETVPQAGAIDLSPDMVALARERNRKAVDRGAVEIVEGNAEDLPWKGEIFSCVASANMFFFVLNPEKVLAEAYRVLKPGGRLAIATMPRTFWFLPMAKFLSMRLYSTDEMEARLQGAGFSEVRVRAATPLDQICYAVK